jgi:hypothetical protein
LVVVSQDRDLPSRERADGLEVFKKPPMTLIANCCVMLYNAPFLPTGGINMRLDSKLILGGCYGTIIVLGAVSAEIGKMVGGIIGSTFGLCEAGQGTGEGIGVFLAAAVSIPIGLALITRLDKVRIDEIAPNPYADGTDPDHGLDTVVVDWNKKKREEYEMQMLQK